MPRFGGASIQRRATLDERLQRVLNFVIRYIDFTIVCGHRGEQEQNEAYENGSSNAKWPQSRHNEYPSKAVDIAPYADGGLVWNVNPKTPEGLNGLIRYCVLAGAVMAVGWMMGVQLRWGRDWDQDFDFNDQRLMDFVHFEIKE